MSATVYLAGARRELCGCANPVRTVTSPVATIQGSDTPMAELHHVAFAAVGRVHVTDANCAASCLRAESPCEQVL
jgi:hypothetical protein